MPSCIGARLATTGPHPAGRGAPRPATLQTAERYSARPQVHAPRSRRAPVAVRDPPLRRQARHPGAQHRVDPVMAAAPRGAFELSWCDPGRVGRERELAADASGRRLVRHV